MLIGSVPLHEHWHLHSTDLTHATPAAHSHPQVRETSRRPLVLGSRGPAPVEKSVEEVRRDFSDIVLAPQLQVRCSTPLSLLTGLLLGLLPLLHVCGFGASSGVGEEGRVRTCS